MVDSMSHGPSPSGVAFVVREAERIGQNCEGGQAKLANHIMIGCMVAMALSAGFQASRRSFGASTV